MCASFTYNKYAKLGLMDGSTLKIINSVLKHKNFKKCIKKLAFSLGQYNFDRLLAIYIFTTGLWGYKLLARYFLSKNKQNYSENLHI